MSVPVFPDRPQVAVPCGCILGEAPIWDGRSGTLYWADINAEEVWSWRPGSEVEPVSRPVGARVGFIQLTPDPATLILGLKTGLARWHADGGSAPTLLLDPEPDHPNNRLNDAVAGQDGSLYFGTMNDSERKPTGSFYRWSEAGLAPFGGHAIVTNGPAIDHAARVLYAADTSNGRVYRHALGPDGTPGPAEPFVTFGEGEGHPDGLTVDAEGHVWICHFRGARVTRFSPAGEAVLVVPMPTSQITKVAFGGPDLATIYVTSAARDRDRETDPMAGHLFTFEAGIRGLPAELCRIGRT